MKRNASRNTFLKKHTTFTLCVCVAALAAVLWLVQLLHGADGVRVVVEADGSLYGTYSLFQEQEIVIEAAQGWNLLVISGKEAYVKEADCSNQICVHTRAISKAGQSIICLPHRVVIRMEGEKGSEVDAVTN